MLNQHALHARRAKIFGPHTKVTYVQITAIFRIRVIIVVEIPGRCITAIPLPTCSYVPRGGCCYGVNFKYEVSASINIEKDRLVPIADCKLQCKVRHCYAGAACDPIERTCVNWEFRGIEVEAKLTSHLLAL